MWEHKSLLTINMSGLPIVCRGNVSMTNLQLLNALLYMMEHDCKWLGLPGRGHPKNCRCFRVLHHCYPTYAPAIQGSAHTLTTSPVVWT